MNSRLRWRSMPWRFYSCSRAKVTWMPGSGAKSGAVVAIAWIPVSPAGESPVVKRAMAVCIERSVKSAIAVIVKESRSLLPTACEACGARSVAIRAGGFEIDNTIEPHNRSHGALSYRFTNPWTT
jgi:hypothetical protein